MKKINHNGLFKLSPIGMLCAVIATPMPLIAQVTEEENQILTIDEIIVTGRKREESLQEVPVSVSVLTGNTIAEQNVLRQEDLAELIPGFTYNQGNGNIDDRTAALPSIRGISSTEIATNRTKVSSFVDGIPILGSVGSINIGGAAQVEVYSGPQSAAFGRSTFGGAINYTTPDPGDELAGSIGVNLSDEGTRIISGSYGGPITDTIGFLVGGQFEDSEAPDDFYTYSDGVEAGTVGGVNASARFVFNPTDNFQAKITFSRDETEDGPGATFYATQQSSFDCYNSLLDPNEIQDMGTTLVSPGVFDCEFERDTSADLLGVHNISQYYAQNTAAFDQLVANAVAAGAIDNDPAFLDGKYTVAEAIALIAEAYSISEDDIGSNSVRDRAIAQFDIFTENDSAFQISLMMSDEEYMRRSVSYESAVPYDITYNPAAVNMGVATPASYGYGGAGRGGMVAQADPTEIEEQYAEVRWASPGDERVRYVVGASYYAYDFLTTIYRTGIYNAVENGTADDVSVLLGGVVDSDPFAIISEETTNLAAFFNVSYDFTDKITGSFEGRYSADDVGANVPAFGGNESRSASQTTNTFTPRLALNYNLDENTTYYLQYAVGVNPSGVNADLLDPTTQATLDGDPTSGALVNGFDVDILGDGSDIQNFNGVDESGNLLPGSERTVGYNVDDYLFYDEEKLTNYEFGFKGTAFDGRVSYSGAIYHMVWEDALQSVTLDWDYEYANDDLYVEGDPVASLVPDSVLTADQIGLGLTYVPETDNTSVRATANQGTIETTGIELQGSFRINENWSLSGNTSFMNAEYTDFCSESLWASANDVQEQDLGFFAGLDFEQNENGLNCYVLDGNKLANQPSFTLSLTPRYETEFNNGIRLSATARVQHESTSYRNDANFGENPSTQTVNLTLALSQGPWSATFYVDNVLGEESRTGNVVEAQAYSATYPGNTLDPSLQFGNGDGLSSFTYQIPSVRSLGMRASYNF